MSAKTCLSEFKTDLLGDNSITGDQFRQTTDSIQFSIANSYLKTNNQITLLIQAYHKRTDSVSKRFDVLINEWTLPVKSKAQSTDTMSNLNEWNRFESTSGNQLIQFAYQLKCSKKYKCEQLSHSSEYESMTQPAKNISFTFLLTTKEICLIILLIIVGVLLFVVFFAIILLRTRSKLEKLEDCEEISKNIESGKQKREEKAEETKSQINSLFDDNLFDAEKAELNEKKLCICTISESLSSKSNYIQS